MDSTVIWVDFFRNHPCRSQGGDRIRHRLLRNAFCLRQATNRTLLAVQMIAVYGMHDNDLI